MPAVRGTQLNESRVIATLLLFVLFRFTLNARWVGTNGPEGARVGGSMNVVKMILAR